MPQRSELGWIVAMAAIAIVIGFVIGGGFNLLSGGDASLDAGAGSTGTGTGTGTSTTAATPSTGLPPVTAPAESTTTTAPPPARKPSDVAVRVYNASSRAGQAVRVGDRLKAAGYNLLTPGPSPKDPIATSVVQFGDGFEAEAKALAISLGLPDTAAVAAPNPPTVAGIGPAQVVLIVGEDLKAIQ